MNPFLTTKNVLSSLLASILAFLLPIQPLLLIVGLCIFLDTASGIYRSYKQKQKISSRNLSAIVSKMILYQTAIILIYIIEKYIAGEMIMYFVQIPYLATKLASVGLCIIEGMSIMENVKIATGVDYIAKIKLVLRRTKYIKKEIVEIIDFDSSDDVSNLPAMPDDK